MQKLAPAGREEFRKSIEKIRKERSKLVREYKGTPEEHLYKGISQSANVRLSEAISFSKALDVGFDPDWTQSYHCLCTQARLLINSGATRGRKAKTDLEKAKEFLAKLALTEDDRTALLEFVSAGCTDVDAE